MSAFTDWWDVVKENHHWAPMRDCSRDAFNAGLEAAAKVCEDEFLEKPTTNMEDAAYNTAIGHCLVAIRALKEE